MLHARQMAMKETTPTAWNTLVAAAMKVVTALSRIDADVAPRTRLSGPTTPLDVYLPLPAVRRWKSPLPARGLRSSCITYDQPGRWMSDDELHDLHDQLRDVAVASIGVVPTHYLLQRENARQALSNRVVSIAINDDTGEAVGFTAMVYLPFQSDVVLHLGLTMIAREFRGRRIQSPLFSKCLVTPMCNLFRTSYIVTNIAASPAGIGACSDYLCDVFPDYKDQQNLPRSWQLGVARHFLAPIGGYRHEFACANDALFCERTFVVRGSNAAEGGGAPEFIKEDGEPVSRYKREKCNEYVSRVLDLARGDELFQVGRVDIMATSLKYLFSPTNSDGVKA